MPVVKELAQVLVQQPIHCRDRKLFNSHTGTDYEYGSRFTNA